MSDYLQAIATILALINPAICGAIFAQIQAGRPSQSQLADATKAVVAVLIILSLAALIGTTILRAFGISLAAFQVAGGAVLVWMGFSMLRGSKSHQSTVQADSPTVTKPVLTPLILFAASPGTITGVITLTVGRALLPVEKPLNDGQECPSYDLNHWPAIQYLYLLTTPRRTVAGVNPTVLA